MTYYFKGLDKRIRAMEAIGRAFHLNPVQRGSSLNLSKTSL